MKKLTTEEYKNENQLLKQEVQTLQIQIETLNVEIQTLKDKYSLQMQYELQKEKAGILETLLQEKNIQTTELLKTSISKPVTSITNNNCTTNNIQMNVLNLSADRIRPAIDSYTIEHYLKGAEGMVEWIVDKVLTDEDGKLLYICTDKNRKHFFFLDENKEKIEDIKAQKLLAAITPEISDKLRECKKNEK